MATRQTPGPALHLAIRQTPNAPVVADKTKSIIATQTLNDSSTSSPSCRKRLTFSDTNDVYEIPPAPPSPKKQEALQKAAASVAEATCAGSWHTTAQRVHAWRVVATHLADSSMAEGYKSSALRRAFATVFSARQPARVLTVAASALKLAAESFAGSAPPSCDDEADVKLCEAVLGALVRGDVNGDEIYDNIVCAICVFGWIEIFPEIVLANRNLLLRQTFITLESPDLSLQTWRATSRLICALAALNRRDDCDDKSLLCDVIGKRRVASVGGTNADGRALRLQVRESDVGIILRTAERMGTVSCHGEAAEAAILALAALTHNNPEVAATVVMEQGASVSAK